MPISPTYVAAGYPLYKPFVNQDTLPGTRKEGGYKEGVTRMAYSSRLWLMAIGW